MKNDWKEFNEYNKTVLVAAMGWLGANGRPVDVPSLRAYCQIMMEDDEVFIIPADHMEHVNKTRWGGDDGSITTIYKEYPLD